MDMTVHADFAERFRQALDEAGFGDHQLKELGRLFKVSPQAVRKWLDGEAMPVSRRAPEIARVLGVRRAWLLDNELPMRPLKADMAEARGSYSAAKEALSISMEEFRLLSAYRALPRALQQSFLGLLDNTKQALGKGKSRKKS